MHELSIVESLRDNVLGLARHHGAARVRRICIDVGALSNVVPGLLEQAFCALREADPLIAEADLVIREVRPRHECMACGHAWESGGYETRCAACAGGPISLRAGEELLLRDVDLEVGEVVAHE